jgi:hypothetical protein
MFSIPKSGLKTYCSIFAERVTQAIIVGGEQTGVDDEEDACDRYGLYFSESIGYII